MKCFIKILNLFLQLMDEINFSFFLALNQIFKAITLNINFNNLVIQLKNKL